MEERHKECIHVIIFSAHLAFSMRRFSSLFQPIRARCSSASCLALSSAWEPVSSSYFFRSTSSLNSKLTHIKKTKYSNHTVFTPNLKVHQACIVSCFWDTLSHRFVCKKFEKLFTKLCSSSAFSKQHRIYLRLTGSSLSCSDYLSRETDFDILSFKRTGAPSWSACIPCISLWELPSPPDRRGEAL